MFPRVGLLSLLFEANKARVDALPASVFWNDHVSVHADLKDEYKLWKKQHFGTRPTAMEFSYLQFPFLLHANSKARVRWMSIKGRIGSSFQYFISVLVNMCTRVQINIQS